jgi:hypothetical protein
MYTVNVLPRNTQNPGSHPPNWTNFAHWRHRRVDATKALANQPEDYYEEKPCGDNGSLVWGGSEPRASPYMTISEEESNLFCACNLLNCDEDQGQWSITGFLYIVSGARSKKKKKVNPAGYRTRVASFYESFSERWRCVSIVIARRIHCSFAILILTLPNAGVVSSIQSIASCQR